MPRFLQPLALAAAAGASALALGCGLGGSGQGNFFGMHDAGWDGPDAVPFDGAFGEGGRSDSEPPFDAPPDDTGSPPPSDAGADRPLDPGILCGDAAFCAPPESCVLCSMQAPSCTTSLDAGCSMGTALQLFCDDPADCNGDTCCFITATTVECAAGRRCMGAPLCDPNVPSSCNKTCQPAGGALMGLGYYDCR